MTSRRTGEQAVRFGVIGINHNHIYGMTDLVLKAGGELVHGDRGSGYSRVDWFTPDGLPAWGDGRLTILGTEGYLELRKYLEIADIRQRPAQTATMVAA